MPKNHSKGSLVMINEGHYRKHSGAIHASIQSPYSIHQKSSDKLETIKQLKPFNMPALHPNHGGPSVHSSLNVVN